MAVSPWDAGAADRYRKLIAYAALRGVVHDLNNPLATVTMAASALRSSHDEAQRAELIDIIEREALRAGTLASTSAEAMAVDPVSVPMTVRELLDAVGQLCRSTGVEPKLSAADAGEARLHADPALLPRAVAAFVADADGTPGRSTPVELSCEVDADVVRLTIRDDGQPIPSEVARQPFRTRPAEGEPDAATRGTGLAVAAARLHVRSVGGRVEVMAGEAGGNAVHLHLPLVATGASAATTGPVSRTGSRRALVVDDNETMRDMLEIVLRRDGWDTVTAADGASAVAAVTADPVDLVLLDVHVGTEHGPDIAVALDEQRPGIGELVVYLSGDVPPSGRIGNRPAVAKPFVIEELYRVADQVAQAAGPL